MPKRRKVLPPAEFYIVTCYFGMSMLSFNAHTPRLNRAIALAKRYVCDHYHVTPAQIFTISILDSNLQWVETHTRDAAGNLFIQRPGKGKRLASGDRKPTPKPVRRSNRGNAPVYYSA